MAYRANTGVRATAFPTLREAALPEYESLSDYEFADAMTSTLGVDAVYAENWLSSLGRTFSQIAPGAVSGAMGGAALGPWGMLGGALLGGLSGALSGGGRPGMAAARPAGPPAGAPGGGAPAAGALMQLLANPSVRQALSSMLLGPGVGRPTVPAGASGEEVPVGAFANLIREAADQALGQFESAGGFAESADTLPDYLAEARRDGHDIGNALVRGVVLAKLLEQPTFVPVTPVAPIAPAVPVAYPAAPAATAPAAAPAQPAAPGAPAAPPTGFEPTPQYGTPDLRIGQPLTIPTQSEAYADALERFRFEQALEEIFDGAAS